MLLCSYKWTSLESFWNLETRDFMSWELEKWVIQSHSQETVILDKNGNEAQPDSCDYWNRCYLCVFSNIKMTNCKNNSFTLYIKCLVGTLTSTHSSPEAAEKSHGSGGRLVFPKGPHEELGLSWRAAPLLERASTTVPGPHVACWESCCFIFAFYAKLS